MAEFFFQVVLFCEAGPDKGRRLRGKVRALEATEEQARRLIIGWVAAQNTPVVPKNADPIVREHIELNWNAQRVVSLISAEEESLSDQGVRDDIPLYWWDWEVLESKK